MEPAIINSTPSSGQPDGPSPLAFRHSFRPLSPLTSLALLLALGWALTFGLCFRGPIIPALGAYATVCAAILGWKARAALMPLLRFSWVELAWGVAAGVAMTAATYLLYPPAKALMPWLPGEVQWLYNRLFASPGPVVLMPVILWVVTLEELLFRGLWSIPLEGDARHPQPPSVRHLACHWKPLVLGTLLYTLVHLPSGAWVLCALTVVVGLVWGAMRIWRQSLWMPLVCHLIWDIFVFILYPLEAIG